MNVKLIKLALISIVFLFLVATAISLMIPSHVRISRAVNLHGSPDSVMSLVKDTARWKEWHPSFLPGDSSYRLRSVRIIPQKANDSEVVMLMQQGEKRPVVNGWKLYEHPGIDSLTLQWYMDFRLKWYPWQKFSSLFFEGTYGAMMEQGLANIKRREEE